MNRLARLPSTAAAGTSLAVASKAAEELLAQGATDRPGSGGDNNAAARCRPPSAHCNR